MPDPVIIIGAGGHAKVVLEVLLLEGRHAPAGFLEADQERWGERLMGVPVLGGDELLPEMKERGIFRFLVGLGGVGDLKPRAALYAAALEAGLKPVRAVHPRAVVSKEARIGPGTAILAGAVVNPGAFLGGNVIVNTGALVEHDCLIEDHAHIATGAILCGGVRVGPGAHVGAGAVVRQGLEIGAGALVGAGAVVVRDVAPGAVAVGNPARPLEKTEGKR